MAEYPKDKVFQTRRTVHETYRWKAYKPQAVKQMKKPGRWQKMVWSGDFVKWENCEAPEGEIVDALTEKTNG